MTDRQLSGQSQTSGAKVCRNWELRQSPEGVSGTEGMCPFVRTVLRQGRGDDPTRGYSVVWGRPPPTHPAAGWLPWRL